MKVGVVTNDNTIISRKEIVTNIQIASPQPLEIVTKLNDLQVALNTDLLERQTEIKTAVTALISQRHHFQIGPPGTAKSYLVRRLLARIGGLEHDDLFTWLLTKYTTPEEIFGPPSLKALEEDIYRRNTEGKLPNAYLAFLDEIFKANSSILNAFLTIMNERLFANGGTSDLVPLQCIFAASNELPHGEELNALWDRLHFRHEIRPMQDKSNFITMLSALRDPNPVPSISWQEIQAAQELVTQVELPLDIIETVMVLREGLAKVGIEPTERRFVDSLAIIQATAFLNGRMVADNDDLGLLRHVMWYRMEDQKVVTQQVLQLSNPIDKDAQDLLDEIEILGSELDETVRNIDNFKARAKAAVQIHGKLAKAKGEKEALQKRAEASGRKSEILDALNDRFISIGKTLMRECFQLDNPQEGEAAS